MSYTNGTTHYNLPLTTGADKRDWSDTNQAYTDVDAALYGAVQDTAQAELDIDALETRMDTAEQNISTNTGNIAGLDTRVTTVEGAVTSLSGQVTDTRQDLEDMICAYNEASATSTHAYGTGENDNHYFIYNDVLYRATQSIAIGDTIVPDTNCETTNVTTEIQTANNLFSGLDTRIDNLEDDIQNLPKTIVSKTGIDELRAYLDTLTASELCNTVINDTSNGHIFHCSLINWSTVTYMFTCLALDLTANLIRIRTISNASYLNSTVYHDGTTANNAALSIEPYTGTSDAFTVITSH